MLADTFLANVTLGRDISEERVWQALETVQLAELARSMSDGIYTPLGEQGIISPSGKSNCWHWHACWWRRRKS
ncbi:multidrug ABC transporter ATP-binding protein [Escherichia coli]|uniref:Multidrug ABC transporter ATP-binding protein n=1 Tax=Escherichia coli TaxID=562 RepID=A0A376U4P2_ECOLX|nr:multidrug ABC transporter ATP-binding protein [Escherichia coli]